MSVLHQHVAVLACTAPWLASLAPPSSQALRGVWLGAGGRATREVLGQPPARVPVRLVPAGASLDGHWRLPKCRIARKSTVCTSPRSPRRTPASLLVELTRETVLAITPEPRHRLRLPCLTPEQEPREARIPSESDKMVILVILAKVKKVTKAGKSGLKGGIPACE